MNLMPLSSKVLSLCMLLLGTTVSVYAHPNIDRSTATNPEGVLEIEPTAYPLAKALGASSHIHPTERVEETAGVASSKSESATLTPPFAGGDGTSGNPYQIATAEQLNEVRNYLDKHFILIADINLNVAPYNTGEGWEPLGNNSSRFKGNFDGNGHTIDGLFIDRPTTNDVGLFGFTDRATIESVGLTNGNVTGDDEVGGLVGRTNNSSKITSSYATGSVTGNNYVGGLVGRTNNLSKITSSYATGSVDGTEDVGGLVGFNIKSPYITDSYATGPVTGNGNNVGGLVGYNTSTSITDSYATGPVTGNGNNVGGLVGYNTSTSITDSYATGPVTGNGNNVGGLVGYNTSTITSSYATGSVTGTENVGGFLGYYRSGSLTHNYWDTQSSGQTKGIGYGKQSGVTGKTSAQMTQQATFKGWDFSTVWAITENITYPWLQNNAQVPAPVPPNPFAGGDGTSGDPYQIATAEQLNEVRNYLDKHFILIANINLDVAPYNTDEGWEPIGNSTTKFTGNVNGNGYTIDGLFINRPSTDYVGLFGYTDGATIESVGLTNGNVTGDDDVGGLVGRNDESTITSSYATGSVTGNYPVGGLVGLNSDNSSITTSYATGSVDGNDYVGGLVGWNTNSSSITSSYAMGNISGNDYVGGLVGRNISSSSITTSYATGSVDGTEYVGGLVGYNSSSSSITDSYATGSVTGTENVGGFLGFYYSGGTLTHNYWDTQSSGQPKGIGNGEQSGVKGKTSAQMTQQATFKGWDFSTVWTITENTTYPWLQKNAQNPPPKPPNPFAGGDGTSGDPYQIATATQLDSVRNYLDKSFILTADINLNVAPYNTGEGWEPLGNSTTKFTGNFNGNGHTIDGLFIDRSNANTADINLDVAPYNTREGWESLGNSTTEFNGNGYPIDGLFISTSSTDYVGLFGFTDGATIESVGLTTVNVKGKYSVGGLVGLNWNSSITSSYATGSVTGDGNVGGLVGVNAESSITDSYATGSIEGMGIAIGGLVGVNILSSSITSSYTTSNVTGNNYVGGLVGYNHFQSSISDSYATGSVTGSSSVGGFIGDYNSGTLTNNYWNTQSSGQPKGIGNGEQPGVTGKTSAQMTQQATFKGWDFSTVWTITENTTYPWLQKNAQNPPPKPSTFAGGDGSPNNPYQIATAGQLNQVRNYLDKHFILIADINLDVAPYNKGKGWKPIGNKKTRFTGNVNGNGHTIDGLFINKSTTNYVGLFGYTQGASIDSVGLTNVNVKGKNSVGGLVGYTSKSSITSSSATGKVKGKSRVGGLAGWNTKSSITTSYATGTVTGNDWVGGLVGDNNKSSSISDSYATGSVTGKSFVGGLAGWNNSSSITSSYATGNVTGKSSVGGFLGYYNSGGLTHNYWDTQSSGKTKGIGNGKRPGVTGKTSAQMTKQATFKGWDFSTVWAITENTTYPWLQKNPQEQPPKPSFDDCCPMAKENTQAPDQPNSMEEEDTPKRLEVLQNYPNPFNPTTNIRFSLPEAGQVRLTVYTMMGQQVKQLANKPYQAGNHVVSFEAGNLASGMYLYQLWVNEKWVGTHKMTLIK